MDKKRTIELELIQRCSRGDCNAFDELYDRFGDCVWRVCCRMTPSTTDAEDMAQEVWVTVWEQTKSFRCECAFSTWLYRVASNVCLQWLRKTRHRASLPLDREMTDGSPAVESMAIDRDEAAKLSSALSTLSDTLRLPLVLRVEEELSYAEIAEVLDCSTAAVKMRIARARNILAGVVKENDDEM